MQLLTEIDEVLRGFLQAAYLDVDAPLTDYGLDSVRAVELRIELEQRFGISIADDEAAFMETARAVSAHVAAKLDAAVS